MDKLIWPGVVLILGIFLIVICRAAFVRLLDRTEKIDKLGVSAPLQDVKTELKKGESLDTKSLTLGAKNPPSEGALLDSKSLMEIPYNETIRAQEKLIKDQLAKIRFENDHERDAYLVRVVARTTVFQIFDRQSFLIYGSQLGILIEANAIPYGVSEEFVRARFQQAKSADPQYLEKTTYESYVAYLLNCNLLCRDGDKLKITICGREFLKYLVDNGATHNRRG